MANDTNTKPVEEILTIASSAKVVAMVRQPIQYKQFHLILEKHIDCIDKDIDEKELYDLVSAYCNNKCANFWFIGHIDEINDDGEIKHPHYHLIIKYPSRKVKNAVMKDIARLFHSYQYDSSNDKANLCLNWISCDGIVPADLLGNIRYLMHLDDEDKQHYKECDVRTNDKQFLNLAVVGGLTIDYLIDVVKGASVSEIVRCIGIENYKNNRWLIQDLIKEFN